MKILTLTAAMLFSCFIALIDAVKDSICTSSTAHAERYVKFGIETKDGYLLVEVVCVASKTPALK